MKPIAPGVGAGIEALKQQVKQLEEKGFVAGANVAQQYDRDLGPEPKGPKDGQARLHYAEMKRQQSEAIERLETSISEARSLLQPLQGLIRMLEDLPAVGGGGRVELEVQARQTALVGVGAVKKMLDAVGPALAGQFPTAQLALIEKSLSQELGELQGLVKQAVVPPKLQLAPVPPHWRPQILSLKDIPDLGSAASSIAKRLGVPGLEAQINAAAPKNDALGQYTEAIQTFALLTDFALGSLDYKRIGGQMTGPGGPSRNRAQHRAREYPGNWLQTSKWRQEQSLADLRQVIQGVIKEPAKLDPIATAFLKEIGLTPEQTKGWAPRLDAIRSALDGEAFAPLRALVDLLPNNFSYQYRPSDIEVMQGAVRKMAKAVVEGRWPEWRLDEPANQAQLAILPEAKRESWLGNHYTQGVGDRGQKLATHEAEGFELFWATKIGGPSHGFDMMTHCVLSILGNVRTKAIIVEDETSHQPVARSYMRLLGNENGKPILFVEDPQFDFDAQRSLSVKKQVVTHAIERARELGAEIVISDLMIDALRELGHKFAMHGGNLLLEPSAVHAESSDAMLGHDQPQPQRLIARSRYAFVKVDLG